MTTLITGGNGFIGAEIAKLLLERGDEDVVSFDIAPASDRLGDGVASIRGDLGNFGQVLNAVEATRPSRIFHLGGMLSAPSEADPAGSLRANALGTYHVLEAARLFGIGQVLFSSTVGTYGSDIAEPVIDDGTLQRPLVFYGVTKVFGEHLGRFYRRKYGLDFRGIRYPSVVGPGVRTPGVAQYTSWVIERCARGEPFTVWVRPDTRVPIVYYKDAALSLLQLAEAPRERIETVVYVQQGITPTPSAGELAAAVRARIPDAEIAFEVDEGIQAILDRVSRPIDDARARDEWGWEPSYQLDATIEDFLNELGRG